MNQMKRLLNLNSDTKILSETELEFAIATEKKINPASNISRRGIDTDRITFCLRSGAKLGKNSEGEYFLYGYSTDGSDIQDYLSQ